MMTRPDPDTILLLLDLDPDAVRAAMVDYDLDQLRHGDGTRLSFAETLRILSATHDEVRAAKEFIINENGVRP